MHNLQLCTVEVRRLLPYHLENISRRILRKFSADFLYLYSFEYSHERLVFVRNYNYQFESMWRETIMISVGTVHLWFDWRLKKTHIANKMPTCSICLENDVEDFRSLRCGHLFHQVCIKRWKNNGGKVCPDCRKALCIHNHPIFCKCLLCI